uniref:AlNc14C41G3476 protein n=1 Tax=Albugo laibachii Nc14 TaxID=890382 RepID=F0W9M1_9STRA|nr:AlNc14C41G3476 [Albugo laibachii Nc14]|eukprot:CCA17839.1 AlNc14C41G3476 [Albugo laibachii Nc14]
MMKGVGGGHVPCQTPAVTPQPLRMTPAMEIQRLKQRSLQLTRALADVNLKLADTSAQLSAANQKISHMDGVITDLQSWLHIGQLRYEEVNYKQEAKFTQFKKALVRKETSNTDAHPTKFVSQKGPYEIPNRTRILAGE